MKHISRILHKEHYAMIAESSLSTLHKNLHEQLIKTHLLLHCLDEFDEMCLYKPIMKHSMDQK